MKKNRFITLMIAVSWSLIVAILFLRGSFQGLENKTVDSRFALRGQRSPDPRVVIITVDEKSIAEMGRWPWPRHIHAQLIELLTKAGAKSIAFDMLSTEVDKEHPDSDQRFAQAAQQSGRVVVGMLFQLGEGGAATAPLFPYEELARRASFMGFVNNFPEADGVSRKVPLYAVYNDRLYPSLSCAALAVHEGKSPEDLLESLNLPLEGIWNEMTVNYVGGFQSFPYFSFVDVLNGKVAPDTFKDKIVLIGGTATALFDFRAVPNVPVFPGLEIHANAIDNYLNKNYLRHSTLFLGVLLILVFGISCGLVMFRLPAWIGAVSIGAWMTGFFFFCQWIFVKTNVVLDFVGPTVSLLGCYVFVLFYRFITEEREKRWIKGTFSQYLSPKVIEVITSDPSRLRLGGEERIMTVFFSDLAGFTSISEALKPPELVAVLNEYLTAMSEIILKYDGVVDKYIGDAIMAFWNAPLDEPRHASLACFSALENIQQLKILQKKFQQQNLPLIDCRIGLNTGNMVVGNMGSKNRFDYTVMGDAVNLGSRLEGANKPFHTRIMVSEFTYQQAKNDVEVRELDLLRVKGKAVPIRVYELVARKGELTETQHRGFDLYAEGLQFYRDRKFAKAIDKFKKVSESIPDDGPSAVYISRSEGYIATPPPPEWDGVYVMTTK